MSTVGQAGPAEAVHCGPQLGASRRPAPVPAGAARMPLSPGVGASGKLRT
ncbi:hypothetical protein [Amycolatopsis magusensis]